MVLEYFCPKRISGPWLNQTEELWSKGFFTVQARPRDPNPGARNPKHDKATSQFPPNHEISLQFMIKTNQGSSHLLVIL